jgi:hypothetical protein
MTEPNEEPALYSFKTEESGLVPLFCKAVRALLARPSLPAREVHLCAVLLRAFERLPLITEGIGISLSLTYRVSADRSWYREIAVRADSVELSEGAISYSPDVGSDCENRTLIEIGVGWREENADLVALEDWLAGFANEAADPEIEVSFDDFGESQLDWSDDIDGADYWEGLESDYE